ncbi:MAG: hypothetical protein ABH816_02100 [Candidatus Levyibacteriota bacterium]
MEIFVRTRFKREPEKLPEDKDVVIIRPPAGINLEEIEELASKLRSRNFLPVIEPEDMGLGGIASSRFWPTDHIREVYPWIFRSRPYRPTDCIFKDLEKRGIDLSRVNEHIVDVGILRGGDYVYLEQNKVFTYDKGRVFKGNSSLREEEDKVRKVFKMMEKAGWELIPLDISRGEKDKLDLDFLLSLFLGKDGKTHAIVPEVFFSQIPSEFKTHTIFDEEVYSGACNIADLRRGTVLVVPNENQSPSINRIIKKYVHPSIDIIEAPPNFLERDGGPRCSISSFSIK